MSIKLDLTAGLSSQYEGIKGYFNHFQETYNSPWHAAFLAFHNNPGSLDIGGTTYSDSYFGVKVIGEHLANISLFTNASFLIKASEVTLEDGAGAHYQSKNMIYSAGTDPTHRLAGDIDTLEFGGGIYWGGNLSGGSLLTVSNLTQHIGTGLLDNNGDGAFDAIDGDVNTNLVHQLVFNLMGGMGADQGEGQGDTGVLENFLNIYGTEQVGTTGADHFDPFDAIDTLVLKGGNDIINAGFQVGAGGDVIDLRGYHSFANFEALETALVKDDENNILLTYGIDDSSHTVVILGVGSNDLTADNFLLV